MTGRHNIHVGCSGWQYDDWRGNFYPKGLGVSGWLEHYAREFDTVEVNATFYRLPQRESVAGWVRSTPPSFIFAIKGSKFITHNKKLKDFSEHVGNLYGRIEPLMNSPQMGPVLWQLPEGFTCNIERLAAALDALPPGSHAFEFRHESWFVDEVYQLLRDHDVGLVIGDHPDRAYQTREITTDFTYVRFHYSHERRSGNYSDAEIDAWARWMRDLPRNTQVFAYFNNDWNAYAIGNARALKRMLGIAGPLAHAS